MAFLLIMTQPEFGDQSMGMSLANKISLFRILLIPLFIGIMVYYSPQKEYLRLVALAVFLLAMLTDAADGYVARIRKEQTQLGSMLDPIADKMLLLSAFLCLSLLRDIPQHFRLPAWVLIVIITRDVIIVLGSAIIYMLNGSLHVIPSKLGKCTTFLQMLTIMSLLLAVPFAKWIWILMVVVTILSGIGYIVRGSRLLNGSEP